MSEGDRVPCVVHLLSLRCMWKLSLSARINSPRYAISWPFFNLRLANAPRPAPCSVDSRISTYTRRYHARVVTGRRQEHAPAFKELERMFSLSCVTKTVHGSGKSLTNRSPSPGFDFDFSVAIGELGSRVPAGKTPSHRASPATMRQHRTTARVVKLASL